MNKLSFKATFSFVFAATLVSGLGDGMIPIAFALQAHRVDPSGRGLTMVLIALWVGRFVSSLVVRKLPPPTRPVTWMLGSDLVRMLAQWVLVAWLVAYGDSISAFAVSSCVYGCASSFFAPARFGLMSQLFTDAQRTRVNSALSMLGDVLFIAGPLIGTAAVLMLGFRTVLLIDGATFFVAMLFVLPFLSVRRTPAADDAEMLASDTVFNAETVSTAEVTTPSTAESTSQAIRPPDTKKAPVVLPRWVHMGLGTWLVAALVNGFLGSAGPTWIMNSFDEKTWGFMATGLTVGSLLGSAATILKALDRVRFSTLQFFMLLLLTGQVLALAFSPVFALIVILGASASLLMTAAGIAWDSLGQSLGNDELVHQFATKDQLVFTAGTPLGMILFAVLSEHPNTAAILLSVALIGSAVVTRLPAACSPSTSDMADANT
ncbi:H+ Antiporter protein [Corynebacterium kutscheri]|uniref:MFS transporter n=1 Tax=Corynebacterium kutscheri TaxID=35755 RepID=UPI000F6D8718|nr:MFS transporter [Corynebacterium kutscheri]VEH81651.1 H+ Antiporter protein [Corynebacterium kutscheri]